MNKRKGIISTASYVNVTRIYRKNIPSTIIQINATSPVVYLLPVKTHLFINVANTNRTIYMFDCRVMRAYNLTNKSTIYRMHSPQSFLLSALLYPHIRVINRRIFTKHLVHYLAS